MTTAFYAHTDTPDGPFTVIVSDGAVLGSGWTSDERPAPPHSPVAAAVGLRAIGHRSGVRAGCCT